MQTISHSHKHLDRTQWIIRKEEVNLRNANKNQSNRHRLYSKVE